MLNLFPDLSLSSIKQSVKKLAKEVKEQRFNRQFDSLRLDITDQDKLHKGDSI